MASKWFRAYPTRSSCTVRLLCVPYGGGSGSEYQKWNAFLPEWIEVVIVHPPGRAVRAAEPAITDIKAYVSAIAAVIKQAIGTKPYALYGHSLGGYISIELMHELRQQNLRLPVHFFAAATSEPNFMKSIPLTRKLAKDMSYDDFIAYLRRLGGTPEEILTNKEVMTDMVMPVMGADLMLVDSYAPNPEEPPLEVPITAIRGSKDTVVLEQAQRQWERHTAAGKFKFVEFEEDHFFLKRADKNGVGALLVETLLLALAPPK